MIRDGIIETARAIGADPLDLATVISYETAGTFDPTKRGPTTQWGQHRGLIQFGEPQARQYGVDWNDPVGSQLGADGAVARYFKASGYKPGMGLLDLYSTVNAGAPGRYNASDANNGGAPGTVQDKVENQMAPHRAKAAELLGMSEGGTMNQTISTRGSQGLLGMLGGGNDRPDRSEALDRIAMGLMSMSAYPTAGMRAQMGAIQDRAQDRRDTKRDATQRNKTADWLRGQGMDQYAAGVESGAITARDAMTMARQQADANDPSVQSSQSLPDNSGVVQVMRDGTTRVVTAGGEVLTGDQAMEFVRKAGSTYTDQQRSIYGARREGTLGADIEMGGEAARVAKEGQMAPETAKEYLQQAELVGSTIRNMDSAIAAIDQGAESGIVYNMLPNVTKASAELANAKQRMGLDVIGSVTFGALSEGELKLAMDTAVPQSLGPEELREWLVQKREAQTKMHAALVEASAHFAGGGTMADYVGKVQGNQPSATPSTDSGGAVQRKRFNPDTGDFE
ncbi:hypothetical protein PVV74_17355 [Roseovarius sp. SK2]|uniref:hypothetical protein n=1 Tax=Roseovarius TaxID=74030 RepID=UPI00237BE6A0|nr:hypothetical protein [Roseovarius sp. SK2]MDD9727231.1 hypothetical protein [Roseovarius sp. SK2]